MGLGLRRSRGPQPLDLSLETSTVSSRPERSGVERPLYSHLFLLLPLLLQLWMLFFLSSRRESAFAFLYALPTTVYSLAYCTTSVNPTLRVTPAALALTVIG